MTANTPPPGLFTVISPSATALTQVSVSPLAIMLPAIHGLFLNNHGGRVNPIRQKGVVKYKQ